MLRSKLNSLIVALGVLFVYFAITGITSAVNEGIPQPAPKAAGPEYASLQRTGPTLTPFISQPDPTRTPTRELLQERETVDLSPKTSPAAGVPGQSAPATPEATSTNIPTAPSTEPPTGAAPLRRTPLAPEAPVRLVIARIHLDAPVEPAETRGVKVSGVKYKEWLVPDKYAVGWHDSSAWLGEPGNTVLNGHHNVYGEVFRDLVELEVGDTIQVYSDFHIFKYMITNKMILPEKYEQLDVRMDNARWILPSEDERLTLITCWPYESNTHRLIIVARPLSVQDRPEF